MENKKVIFIAGPTAVGKTDLSILIAKKLNGEIISCDSMQLYKYMDIGSAKPTKKQLEQVPHHMIGEIDPREEFSAAKYQVMAKEVIADVLSRNKTPIVAGGTGLYLNSLVYEMDFGTSPEDTGEDSVFSQFRNDLYKIAEEKGNLALHEQLKELDSAKAIEIHPNNVRKVVRAIEAATFGKGIGEFSKANNRTEDYDVELICLTRDREQLYERINKRVDMLVEEGLIEEVKNLTFLNLTDKNISMKGIGYKEIISHLNGESTLEEAIKLIKRNTRRFAKRQITWFKRYEDMKWFNLSEYSSEENALKEILQWIQRK